MKKKKNIKKKIMSFDERGFTFIEIILGMAIVVFLSASMFQIISVSNTQQGLNINAEKVKALLRLAQSYSLSIPQDEVEPKHICGFGIYAKSNRLISYYIYIADYEDTPKACGLGGLKYSPRSGLTRKNMQTITLDSGYSFKLPSDIFFESPYGRVISDGTELSGSSEANILVVNLKTNNLKTIRINSSGKINF